MVVAIDASDAAGSNFGADSVETLRLRLRLAQDRDAAALAAMMTGAVSRRLASWPVPFTPAMAEERIRGVRLAAEENRSVPMVIERREDGAVCGWISVSVAPGEPRCALLTYWLGPPFHRQGLMREAAPAAMARAFRALDVETIRAAVQPDNAASLAVVERLGMRPLGAGRIWCPAREREETCLWFELPRPPGIGYDPAAAAAERDLPAGGLEPPRP